ncbi:FkbM family methyltransferase [Pseudoroseomonas wenyumeiae]|uniref:FkbM family methyltransferase n=1 Tax=Teichococcus wenyumeiae TaxID=2478470 RepID=A0A3A9JJI6_9PROT|nr:FkbM family methyltransferase [Pseudoroseomonas wenyumeiae]RKK03834.1 FkbM family methyltransferase [Pseudoroseomonas wenyumeiae]RMI16916.1 FkbM family methyltransferase [Pseudoroseomonas wenyumeiae]
MIPTTMRETALRAACAGLRMYFQHAPFAFGKQRLWDQVVQRYIAWRRLEIEARTRFGARFAGSFPDAVHSYAYFFGIWEPAVTAFYRHALRPGDVVVDIGANVGMHALLAAHLVGPDGQVHAIEASSWIHERLRQNLRTNGIYNVATYNMAVTEVPGMVPVFVHDDTNLGGTTIVAAEASKTQRQELVEGRPLGDILPVEVLRAARLIKIDVEGAEIMVVKGMRDLLPLLRQDVEILVEVKTAALAALGSSLQEFLNIFAEAGFKPFEIANAYDGAFYIGRKHQAAPAPLQRYDFEMADLLFRRVAGHCPDRKIPTISSPEGRVGGRRRSFSASSA